MEFVEMTSMVDNVAMNAKLQHIRELYYSTSGTLDVALVIFIIAGVVSLISLVTFYNGTAKRLIISVSPSFAGFAITMALMIFVGGIQDQRDLETEEYYKQMSCFQLRATIIDIIENDSDDKFEIYMKDRQKTFIQELYQYRCETPLRDEVLKLQ